MNAIVDYGNSRIKIALFEGDELKEKHSIPAGDGIANFLDQQTITHLMVSSVTESKEILLNQFNIKGQKYFLSHDLPLPFTLNYKTPETLGVDRIAAACGAAALMPRRDVLVIDAGTCVNIEFINKDLIYYGGSIAPGVKMRFEAMHKFTSRLPLITAKSAAPLTGTSTEECMQSGVVNGMTAELNGILDSYKEKYPNMGVILCGGDSSFFENNLKHPIFVAPDLVLIGLNRILLHNVGL